MSYNEFIPHFVPQRSNMKTIWKDETFLDRTRWNRCKMGMEEELFLFDFYVIFLLSPGTFRGSLESSRLKEDYRFCEISAPGRQRD